ncbi:MAG: SDR family NAD(P)-dependent oxidoreductase [Deltaproteobacteria bacterium]|nr:SDR family NAD(P)-dependent oxidoreductase [Deltaproteobacteria bacterium]
MRRERFLARYGPWALVSGAAQGIGAAFARELAGRGLDLLLVDCDSARVEELASEIELGAGVRCRPVDIDLGAGAFHERLLAAIDGLEIGLLVFNAARSYVAPFLSRPVETQLEILAVNARAPLVLAQALGAPMVARGRGGLVFMCSLASLGGHALTAAYAASKAFDLVLAESLAEEWRPRGVDVLAVCAGPTATPGYLATAARLPSWLVQSPEQVAREALSQLGRRSFVVSGVVNRLTAAGLRLLPRSAAARAMGWMMRSVYPG